MANIANPLPYITKREYGIVPDLKATLFDNRLSAAKNLYRKDLKCHFGCVNAIEFSSNGELLISGGDDRRVMLWQFGQSIVDRGQPEVMKTIHQSNIFCLGITKDMTKIYSGGNDDMVIVHDIESKRPLEVLSHQRAVCCLSIDPYNDRVVATAGNDGRLLLFDTRQSVHESLVISRSKKAFHGVMFHPSQQGILVSANSRDGVGLWDLKAPKHPVMRYSSNHGTGQNCMSVSFNRAGSHVLALRRRLAPVLYALHSPEPVAEFYHQDYYNSCTMKSCSFAGEGDKYVLSGSDDFNLYMWKVPEPGSEDMVVESPHIVLYGHRSIVNQVRFNPQYSLIASSGVEKIIKLWSTMEYPTMRGALLEESAGSDNPREIYSHEDYMSLVHHDGQYIAHNYTDQSTSEDPRMMAFFDSLVQRELECLAEDSDSCGTSDTLQRVSSSGDEEMFIPSDFLPLVLPPTRVFPPGNRSQRCPNRLVRLVASRYPQSSRSQKRGSVRHSLNRSMSMPNALTGSTILPVSVVGTTLYRLLRTNSCINMAHLSKRTKHLDRRALLSKFKMLPTRASAKGKQRSSGASRTSRGLERGRCALHGPRRGSPSPSSSRTDRTDRSDRTDSDEPRALYRADGRNLRPLRRRMNLSRAAKRKNKTTSYIKTVMNLRSSELAAVNDNAMNFSNGAENMALPSTSTGYRGESTAALFRINEVDSDDDQSVGSVQSGNRPLFPHNLIAIDYEIPNMTRMNEYNERMTNDSTQDSLIVEPPESDSTPPPEIRHRMNLRRMRRTGRNLKRSDSSESPRPKDASERASAADRLSPKQGYNNRTIARLMNETNESELESSCSTEGSMWPAPASLGTPDSGVGTAVGSSSRRSQPADEVSDDPDWQAHKFRQRVKKARRNYRKHMDSDSN